MKKSLIALAILGGFSGMAAAQSSVTLFSIIDLGVGYVKNDAFSSRKSMITSGHSGNRLGLRGVEDLGGGLRAGFWIEGATTPDDGTAGGQQWTRRSTVSLLGGLGRVTRRYSAPEGLGSAGGQQRLAGSDTASTYHRSAA